MVNPTNSLRFHTSGWDSDFGSLFGCQLLHHQSQLRSSRKWIIIVWQQKESFASSPVVTMLRSCCNFIPSVKNIRCFSSFIDPTKTIVSLTTTPKVQRSDLWRVQTPVLSKIEVDNRLLRYPNLWTAFVRWKFLSMSWSSEELSLIICLSSIGVKRTVSSKSSVFCTQPTAWYRLL